jgi:ElaA protein
MIKWECKAFSELTVDELYAILRLRSSVFVVEQNCPYLDCDGKDQASYHLGSWDGEKPLAYARLLPPGLAYKEPSIGRVVSDPSARRTGIGRELMAHAMKWSETLFGKQPIQIGAQLYLKSFYESFGFAQVGEIYDEDGIDHIHMVSN